MPEESQQQLKIRQFEEFQVQETNQFHEQNATESLEAFAIAHRDLLANSVKWTSKDNSSYFENVKNSLRELAVAYYSSTSTVDLTGMLGLYQTVINDAEGYLNARSGFTFTQVGKERKRIMRSILDSARREYPLVISRYQDRAVTEGNPQMWHDILADVRMESIDLSTKSVTTTGDRTSTVTVIRDQVGTANPAPIQFFKDEERLLSIEDARKEVFRQMRDELSEQGNVAGAQAMEMLRSLEPGDGFYRVFMTALSSLKSTLADNIKFNTERGEKLAPGTPHEIIAEILNRTGKTTSKQRAIVNAVAKQLSENESFMDDIMKYCDEYKKFVAIMSVTDSARIDHGTLISTRNVATSRMADMLNVAPMMARSRTVEIIHDGVTRRGNAMEGAKGTKYRELPAEIQTALKSCPEYMRDLSKLWVFDYICGQVDRHTANYFVDAEMVEVDGVRQLRYGGITGIDNDMAFGKLTSSSFGTSEEISQLSRLVNSEGNFNMPYMDKELAASILALTPEMVTAQFADLLSKDEMRSLMSRLTDVYRAIEKMERVTPDKLLEPDEWAQKNPTEFTAQHFQKRTVVKPDPTT